MNENVKAQETEEEKLFSSILYLKAKAMGLVLGLLGGLVIFIATNWLVIKGGKGVINGEEVNVIIEDGTLREESGGPAASPSQAPRSDDRSMRLTAFSLNHNVAVLVLCTGILLIGGFSYFDMPRESYPDIDFPFVLVTTTLTAPTPRTSSSRSRFPWKRNSTASRV